MRNRPPSLFVQANPLKPQNQVAILASMAASPAAARGGSAFLSTKVPALPRKVALATYKHGVPWVVRYYALKPAFPAIRGDRKLGIRFGSDRVMPLGMFGGPLGMYVTPSLRKLPVPIFGFGFTAVKNDESFWPTQQFKSRGGEHTTSSGTPETATNTIVGPLAKNRQGDSRPSSITPSAPGRGNGRKTGGATKRAVRPRRTTPPYCWRHKKRHYCKYTK